MFDTTGSCTGSERNAWPVYAPRVHGRSCTESLVLKESTTLNAYTGCIGTKAESVERDTELRFVLVVSWFLHWFQLMFAMRKQTPLIILTLAELPRAT